MLLNLAKIIENPNTMVSFQASLDLSALPFGGGYPAQEPVVAQGTVRNAAGVLLLDGQVSTTLHGVCDRCAAEFQRTVCYPIHAVLVRELSNDNGQEDPWVFLLRGDDADIDDIVTSAFVLNMDSKLLCRQDCKGLCCRCGKNLNEGPCSCQPEADPRLAVLKQLLKDKA